MVVIFVIISFVIIKSTLDLKKDNLYTINVLESKKDFLNDSFLELNKEQVNVQKNNKTLEEKLVKKTFLINDINKMGNSSVTDKLNRMELVINKNQLLTNGFSLKDNEIYLNIIESSEFDTVRLLNEFEKEFSFVRIMERGSETIVLMLGDRND